MSQIFASPSLWEGGFAAACAVHRPKLPPGGGACAKFEGSWLSAACCDMLLADNNDLYLSIHGPTIYVYVQVGLPTEHLYTGAAHG